MMSSVRVRQTTQGLLRNPLIAAFTAANAFLAAAHLIPPSAAVFGASRAFLAVARSFQGLLEFLSFSLLTTGGFLTPFAMFVTITLLAPLLAMTAKAVWRSGDELREILPVLVLISLGSSILAAHAGNLLVSGPVSCTIEVSPSVSQRVVTYYERGWNPGAYYFLLEAHPTNGNWHQLKWARLDRPIVNPCDVLADIFPPDE